MKISLLALAGTVCVAPVLGTWSAMEAKCLKLDKPSRLEGRRALIITTSHGVLGDSNCTDCDPTGVYGEEFTKPFLMFQEAGMHVTLASIAGGKIPVDPMTFKMGVKTQADTEFFGNSLNTALLRHSPSVAEVDFEQFDIIFMAGGWGAAWDLGTSQVLAKKISQAYARDQLLGSVCHGALGFVKAVKPNGESLCKGKLMTGVTNKQIKQLHISNMTPMHPEDELKKAGAIYKCRHGFVTDVLQDYYVADGNIVTGQNQMASCEVPQILMRKLEKRIQKVVQALDGRNYIRSRNKFSSEN
mmetsp:Transcript_10518/g.17160  ORF Transcript_10518/g.17160 Transcript_10518/m.17160 type:complete len:300 (-) Transcript_10518:2441-3340(-)